MMNILIDSDVILDFFFDREPYSEDAAAILSLCETRTLNGFITPVILSNTYYLLRRTSTHLRVINKLGQLLTIIDVLTMNKRTSLNAVNSKFKDFEDAMQNFAAENHGDIEAIITRNVKDYRESNLLILTPDNFLKISTSKLS
ncbi:MAG: PIN domain-containing protein [Bacteroidia bacterium]|nr:PIN domain-containing protein [Bacteroidia bacterium]